MDRRIDPRVDVGHVHLKVADLDRSVAFYTGALGLEVTQRMGQSAAFLSAGGYHHHLGLNTWQSRGGAAPPAGSTGLFHFALRYPDRSSLGTAIARLREYGVQLDGAADHGVSEAVYLHDPDGNGIELYWDRPRMDWPRAADGVLRMVTEPLDVDALVQAAHDPAVPAAPYAPMRDQARQRLRDLRARLLHLHKVLLEDTRTAYELDRGSVGSNATLLQLVINDPWFAWLRALSELVVRIDQAVESDSPASDADAAGLVEQTESLLTASEEGDGFARRYFEALQRQPAVVMAHAEVRRLLKASK